MIKRGKLANTAQGEEGQASVEFALTIILLMGFILFILQMTLVFAWGNYIHYATFMSARAYLAAGSSVADQEQRARDVLESMVKKGGGTSDRLPFVSKGDSQAAPGGIMIGTDARFTPGERSSSWMEGVRYKFKSRLFLIPFAGSGNGKDSANSLTLTSESWLGREPSYQECLKYMGTMKGIIDNGC